MSYSFSGDNNKIELGRNSENDYNFQKGRNNIIYANDSNRSVRINNNNWNNNMFNFGGSNISINFNGNNSNNQMNKYIYNKYNFILLQQNIMNIIIIKPIAMATLILKIFQSLRGQD